MILVESFTSHFRTLLLPWFAAYFDCASMTRRCSSKMLLAWLTFSCFLGSRLKTEPNLAAASLNASRAGSSVLNTDQSGTNLVTKVWFGQTYGSASPDLYHSGLEASEDGAIVYNSMPCFTKQHTGLRMQAVFRLGGS